MRCLLAASAALVLFAGFAVPALAQASPARSTVDRVAGTLETHYWDAEAGRRIAATLRDRAAQGAFDTYRDPAELASALSAALAEHDRHVRVTWTAVDDASSRATPAGPDAGQSGLRERRSGHGVRRVQRLAGNVGLLELAHFADVPADAPDAPDPPARRQIDAALAVLGDVDALLIDLRDNGGGSPTMVGYLASAFLPPGLDAYNRFRHRDGSATEAPARPYPRPDPDVPLFVLVGPRTASAAEAFAYTLQQAGRARIVGAVSAGAANPGTTFDAGPGLSVFVPTGSPLNPVSADNWEGRGVQPDLPAAVDDAERVAYRAALEAAQPHLAGAAAHETRWLLAALDPAAGILPAADVPGRYDDCALVSRADGLWLQQGRRPERLLLPLSADLFTFADDRTRRVRIQRDQGAIVAMEILDPWQPPRRFRRDPAS